MAESRLIPIETLQESDVKPGVTITGFKNTDQVASLIEDWAAQKEIYFICRFAKIGV